LFSFFHADRILALQAITLFFLQLCSLATQMWTVTQHCHMFFLMFPISPYHAFQHSNKCGYPFVSQLLWLFVISSFLSQWLC